MRLLTLNQSDFEPTGYEERKTVKAVIVNDIGETLLFGRYLVGGGVEAGETYEEALHREALEEAGAKIEIIKPLGEVVSYRDEPKKKYVVMGFLCKFIETVGTPTPADESEVGIKISWMKPEEAIALMKSELTALMEGDKTQYSLDGYQSRLYNRQGNLRLMEEVFKNYIN